ncbi:MAG TPA: hypothetical protein VFC86_11915 [Planctomycetota bacterium]|nr:hypothetical protein [Planctomycetota bacterium]
MKNSFHVSAALALAFGAAALFAQDKPAKEPTGAEKLMAAIHKECCKAEKCEGEQKKVCDNVAGTVKAAMGKCGEKGKKAGLKCEECAKAKDGGPCDGCRDLIVKTAAPWLKTQAEAKDAKHTLGTGEKKETIKCTLLSGPACKGCAEELSDALVKACKEAGAEKK